MTEAPRFRRGDVVLARVQFVTDPTQIKLRPAVVIQNDRGNRVSPNLIVATISSRLPRRAYPTDFVIRRGSPESEGSGLDRDSVVEGENIFTIPKDDIARRIGRFNHLATQEIDRCLRRSLAL